MSVVKYRKGFVVSKESFMANANCCLRCNGKCGAVTADGEWRKREERKNARRSIEDSGVIIASWIDYSVVSRERELSTFRLTAIFRKHGFYNVRHTLSPL